MSYRFKIAVRFILIFLTGIMGVYQLDAQTLAFPGAEGFGAYSQGGRGGDVYTVTNTNDSGPGSLRYGIQSAGGPRTIVFAVSGLIQLKDKLSVDKDYITIAGQTAPGDGICLRDDEFRISADHVIVRYIRSRLGDEALNESDAISITRGNNIILDHCSASWSVDECFSCSTGDPNRIDNVTVQWSIISEALDESIHSKGSHSYGALIRGCYGAKYSYHHNLFAHNKSRNPRPGNYDYNTVALDPEGLQFDFRNNVMYNWSGSRPGYDADTDSRCRYNYVGNYGKPGPNSNSSGSAYGAGSVHFRAFYSDNYFFGRIPEDQWSLVSFGGRFDAASIAAYKMTEPFSTGPIVTQSPEDAFTEVLAHAGASFVRDTVDTRVINDVINGTGKIIDDEDEVGSWPSYNTYGVKTDTDLDGMPDEWENENGLNPDDPEDRNDDRNKDGYTNLEEYLNSLVNVYSTLKPVVTMISPLDEEGYLTSDTVFIKAEAGSYGNDTIESIDLYFNDTLVSNFASSTVDTFITGIPVGVHYIKVKAWDQGGKSALDSSKIYSGSAKYTLHDSIVGEGEIILDPPGGVYLESMLVKVTASPVFPYYFEEWTGDTSETENPLVLTLTRDMTIIARFAMDSSAVLKINFQPETSDVPEGYFPDYGYEYALRDNGQSYGWVGKDNFEVRERSHPDLRKATLNHMQKSGNIPWEIKVEKGHYVVNLHMGDAENTDQDNSIDVEGIQVPDITPGSNFDEFYIPEVPVGDGKMTFTSTGDNAKLNFMELSSIPGNFLIVTGGTGGGEYDPGTFVTIAAHDTPPEVLFEGWTGDVEYLADSMARSTTVTMPEGVVAVSAKFRNTIGISGKPGEHKSIQCFPNPSSSGFSIELTGIGPADIGIYNMLGHLVYSNNTKDRLHHVADRNLFPGLYLVVVSGGNRDVYFQKLLIQ